MKKDIINPKTGQSWIYSKAVKDHFFNPQNILAKHPKKSEYNGYGSVGSPACGDVMDFYIKIDPKTEKIKDVKWKTFGCASAIASTSVYSVMLKEKGGLTIKQALKIKPKDIIKRLGGLPDRKIHCSVLADQAFKKAVENYQKNK